MRVCIDDAMIERVGWDSVPHHLRDMQVKECDVPWPLIHIFKKEAPVYMNTIRLQHYNVDINVRSATLVAVDNAIESEIIAKSVNALPWITGLEIWMLRRCSTSDIRSGLRTMHVLPSACYTWITKQRESLRVLSAPAREIIGVFPRLHTLHISGKLQHKQLEIMFLNVRYVHVNGKKVTRHFEWKECDVYCRRNRHKYKACKLLWLLMYRARVPKDVCRIVVVYAQTFHRNEWKP